MSEETKDYSFNFVAENLTRKEAEEIHDAFMERAPMAFYVGPILLPFNDRKRAKVIFVGMNEVEEDSDVQEEASS